MFFPIFCCSIQVFHGFSTGVFPSGCFTLWGSPRRVRPGGAQRRRGAAREAAAGAAVSHPGLSAARRGRKTVRGRAKMNDGIWGFSRNGGYPQNGWLLWWINPIRMDDLGYPHFRKPPYCGWVFIVVRNGWWQNDWWLMVYSVRLMMVDGLWWLVMVLDNGWWLML